MFAPSGGKNALCLYLRDLSHPSALFAEHTPQLLCNHKRSFLPSSTSAWNQVKRAECREVISHQRTLVQKHRCITCSFISPSNTTLTAVQKGCLNKSANLEFNEVKAVIKGTFLQLYENYGGGKKNHDFLPRTAVLFNMLMNTSFVV